MSMIWNTLAGTVSAAQSAVILVFLSYRSDIETAGMVTIAYATANLFYAAAQYGMRNFQVTDIQGRYRFNDYLAARMITIAAAMALLILYLLYAYHVKSYVLKKLVIIFEVSVWKFVDGLEDVFTGQYQKIGRLDIGAKITAVRMAFSTALVCFFVLLYADIRIALAAGIFSSVLIDICCISRTFYRKKDEKRMTQGRKTAGILKDCMPLCIGSVLGTYVGNAPKYMIDRYMDERVQAVFGYLMLPVFVILLLNNFIYQPAVKGLGDIWGQGKVYRFWKKVICQCLMIAILTIFLVFAGKWACLPVLSFVYRQPLEAYGMEFMILLLGGGFFAMASYLHVPLTVIRKQKYIAWGYLAAICFIWICGGRIVLNKGMMGAAVLYLVLNMALAAWHLIILWYGSRKGKKGGSC